MARKVKKAEKGKGTPKTKKAEVKKPKANAVPTKRTERNQSIIAAFLKGESTYSIAKRLAQPEAGSDGGISQARVEYIIGAYLRQEFRAGRLTPAK